MCVCCQVIQGPHQVSRVHGISSTTLVSQYNSALNNMFALSCLSHGYDMGDNEELVDSNIESRESRGDPTRNPGGGHEAPGETHKDANGRPRIDMFLYVVSHQF